VVAVVPAAEHPAHGPAGGASPRSAPVDQRSYAGLTAAQLIDHVVQCRQAGRREDPSLRAILDDLRRAYGHPSYPFAASLERLAFATHGPALFQETMEPDEVEIVNTIWERLTADSTADDGGSSNTENPSPPQTSVRSLLPSRGQRADCPHAPHTFSCGPLHTQLCVFAHQGACAAVHPVCPACHTAHPDVVVSSIAASVRAEGVCIAGCSACGRLSFRYDADLVCGVCGWLVPDVNERLAERFAANGGPFVPDPGT
jgi:hypothetical protein